MSSISSISYRDKKKGMINVAPSLNDITTLVFDVAHNYMMTSCKFIIFIISMA